MKPCRNPHCKSHGSSHPNCMCYGGGNGYAEGGEVKDWCDQNLPHKEGCEYFKGGNVDTKKGFNYSGFNKVKEDKKSVTMAHPNGHQIVIAKAALPHIQRKQLERLPMHLADGGNAIDRNLSEDTPQVEAPPVEAPTDTSVNRAPAIIDNPVTPSVSEEVPNRSPAADVTPAAIPATPGSENPSSPINVNDLYAKSLSAIGQKASAEAGYSNSVAADEAKNQAELKALNDNWLKTNSEMQANIGQALQDVKDNHIKPNHYVESMGTGQKIATGIGLLLGGFTGGFNRTGVNPAADWLNKQIDRDVEAQKEDQGNRLNIYKGYLQQFNNAQVADQMARATQMGIYASRIRADAAKAGTPLALANGNLAATELEQKMIPLVNNAHLINQFAQFSGANGSSPTGSENKYKVALAAAQRINPDIYKDQQSKYVPGVGVASHPVEHSDAERLANLNALMPLIDKAVADQKHFGLTGAQVSMHPIRDMADAASDRDAIQVQLNKLTGLNRLNDREYQNYGSQIGNVGDMNLGGTLRTLQNLKDQATMDRNSAINSMGITPFSDAAHPSGLNAQQQGNLNIFLKNNPKVDQGTAIKVLKEKGLL